MIGTAVKFLIVLGLSSGAAGLTATMMDNNPATTADTALKAQLIIVRQAIEFYKVQHEGKYPGQSGDGDLETQLCGRSSKDGMVGTSAYYFPLGPYIRNEQLPENPFVANNSVAVVKTMPTHATGRTAWIYCSTTGEFRANTNRVVNGVPHFKF